MKDLISNTKVRKALMLGSGLSDTQQEKVNVSRALLSAGASVVAFFGVAYWLETDEDVHNEGAFAKEVRLKREANLREALHQQSKAEELRQEAREISERETAIRLKKELVCSLATVGAALIAQQVVENWGRKASANYVLDKHHPFQK